MLLSAIRKLPSSEGSAHNGKAIRKDIVAYFYEQVGLDKLRRILGRSFMIFTV